MIVNPAIAWILLLVLWIIWILPFAVRRRGGGQKAAVTVPRARWGMILQGVGFAIASLQVPRPPFLSLARVAVAVVPSILAIVLGFSSTVALGKQWRFDAALNPDHDLIQNGPYSIVRHPIYASMLLMLLTTNLIVSNWIELCFALPVFFIGTEIRIRIEENLLLGRFGNRYEEYRRRVPAYVPGIR